MFKIYQIALPCGRFALIDEQDFEDLRQFKWFSDVRKGQTYVHRNAGKGRKDRRIERLHRRIMQATKGQIVDHINGDGLDNRRCNLRLVTVSQNGHNTGPRVRNKSGYKGVSPYKGGKWQAHLKVGGKRLYLGVFTNVKEAARAYNKAVYEYVGEHGRLNDIDIESD